MKPLEINDKEYFLEPKDEALILAIQELTRVLRGLRING